MSICSKLQNCLLCHKDMRSVFFLSLSQLANRPWSPQLPGESGINYVRKMVLSTTFFFFFLRFYNVI